jgi:hypothetical protein
MKAPRYRIHGWSWLGILNFVLIQWFFVRLEATVNTPVVPGESEMGRDAPARSFPANPLSSSEPQRRVPPFPRHREASAR